MTVRRALVVGGTGMLADCTASLVAEGWRVVLPSRRYAPISTETYQPDSGHNGGGHDLEDGGRALWVQADWTYPQDLAERAGKALGGPADLLVAWVHREQRGAVFQAVRSLLAPGAPVVEVRGSIATDLLADAPEPLLADHPTQIVVLGFVRTEGTTRWLTHQEIADGVLDAVRRALEDRPPAIHQVGEPRPSYLRR